MGKASLKENFILGVSTLNPSGKKAIKIPVMMEQQKTGVPCSKQVIPDHVARKFSTGDKQRNGRNKYFRKKEFEA